MDTYGNFHSKSGDRMIECFEVLQLFSGNFDILGGHAFGIFWLGVVFHQGLRFATVTFPSIWDHELNRCRFELHLGRLT